MFLSQVMDDLIYGDLRQVFLSSNGEMTVSIEHRREIIALISSVLTDIHSKLKLKYGKVKVLPREVPGQVLLNSDEPYIENILGNVDNILSVVRVTSTDKQGRVDNVNFGSWEGITPVRHDSFYIGATCLNLILEFDYISDHDKLDVDKGIHNPEAVWIELPQSLYRALILGVCARRLGTVGIPQTGSGQGYVNYLGQYLRELESSAMLGRDIGDIFSENSGFTHDGWK